MATYAQDQAVGPGSWTIAPLRSLAIDLTELMSEVLMENRARSKQRAYVSLRKPKLLAAADAAIRYRALAEKGTQFAHKITAGHISQLVLDEAWARATSANAEFQSVLETPGRAPSAVDEAFATVASIARGDLVDDVRVRDALELFLALDQEFNQSIALSQPMLEGDGLL